MSFSHNGYFPFCIKPVESVDSENARYNNSYSGFSGVGKIYPTGMTLFDAMALYWKTKYINWNFFASRTLVGECTIYTERSSIGPYYPLGYPQEENNKYQILRKKVCGGNEENPERYSLRFTGQIYNFFEISGDPEICAVGEQENISYETPFFCFFTPRQFFDPDTIEDQEKDFARIIYNTNTGLYYPSMLAAYWGYSRLFLNQKFIASDSEFESETFEDLPMNINDNTYDIPLLQVYNYTPDPPWTGYSTGEISCITV